MKEKSKRIVFDYPRYDELGGNGDDITAIYLRVSTDMQAQDGYGLDVQYSALHKYCSAYELKNPVVFIDDGYTGVNDSRPAFQQMLSLMRKGRIKFVLTYSLDRIGRTQMLILKFLKEDCVAAGCDFLAVKDNVDSRSKQTYGILISILSIFAEFDHDAIVAKLTSGRKQRAIEGYWKGGGKPPYGYIYSKQHNNLVPDPERAQTVKKVFEMYNTNEYSPRRIAQILGLSGDASVFGILKNRTYLGEITFRGEQFKGRHAPLIDEQTFARAQALLHRRSTKKGDSHYLLSSLLVCGDCGAKMRYMKWGRGKNQTLKILCYSRFPSTKQYLVKDANCPNMIYDAAEVECSVIDAVLEFAVQFKDELKYRAVSEEDVIGGLQKKYDGLQIEYDRAVKAYTRIGDEKLLDIAEQIRQEQASISRDIAEEKEKQTILRKIQQDESMLRTLPDTWKAMTDKEKQNVMRSLVTSVILTGGEVKVVLNSAQFKRIDG